MSKLKFLRGSTSSLSTKKPTLDAGQPLVEYLSSGAINLYIGAKNGSTVYSSCPKLTSVDKWSGYTVSTSVISPSSRTTGTNHKLGQAGYPFSSLEVGAISLDYINTSSYTSSTTATLTPLGNGTLQIVAKDGNLELVSGWVGSGNRLNTLTITKEGDVTGTFTMGSGITGNLNLSKFNQLSLTGNITMNNNSSISTYDSSNPTLVFNPSTTYSSGHLVLYLDVSGLYPRASSSSSSVPFTLGTVSNKWGAVYATTGSIQTSDESSKTNIRRVIESSSHVQDTTMSGPSIDGDEARGISEITVESVIDFLRKIDPVTFTYKTDSGSPDEFPAATQLGLIADDYLDSDIYKYIGVKEDYQIPDPDKYKEVMDEESEHKGQWREIGTDNYVSYEDTTKITKTSLGLQPLPVATLALVACKYLINKLETFEKGE